MIVRPRALLMTCLVVTLGAICVPTVAQAQNTGPVQHVLVIPRSNPASVIAKAQQLGLTAVTGPGGSAVDVSGPARLMSHTFGHGRRFGILDRSAFGSSARAILDPSDSDKVFFAHAGAPLTGGQMIKDYGARQAVTGVATPDVANRPIVASIQLSRWNPASLAEYAKVNRLYADKKFDPVASKLYANRPVLQRTGTSSNCQNTDPRKRPLLDDGGQEEVVLDQEAILGAAPTLRQWSYTAANTSSCILSAYLSVLDDVRAGKPIVALTTSWGACEAYLTDNGANADLISMLNNVLGQLSAAGVTITAASGDAGMYDCLDAGGAADQLGVDFPASSPYVLAVGATEHVTGRADLAWNDGLSSAGTGGGTSGIGIAGTAFTGFAKPAWQNAVGTAGDRRELPDVAINGDPQTGIIARLAGSICTDPRPYGLGQSKSPCSQIYGGTSLSAPLMAAALSQLIADHANGVPAIGKGLLHPLLYSHQEAVTDVTDLTDPTHRVISPVGIGYDRATGLGVPTLPLIEAALFAPAPAITAPALSADPTIDLVITAPAGITPVAWFVSSNNQGCAGPGAATAPTTLTLPDGKWTLTARALTSDGRCTDAGVARVVVDSTRPALRVTTWKRADSSSTRLTAKFTIREAVEVKAVKYVVRRTDNHRLVARGSVSAKTRKINFTGQPGKRYEIAITPYDVIGAGPTSLTRTTLPVDDRQANAAGGWTAASTTGAYLGTVSQTSRAGATLQVAVNGSVVGALFTKSPLGGRAALIVDGQQRKVIDLSSPTTTVNVAVQIRVRPGRHMVQIRALGARGSLGRGAQVTVDAFLSG